MTQKTAKQLSPELRERAVRMVQDREREGGTQWESIALGDFAARSAEIAARKEPGSAKYLGCYAASWIV